MSFSDKYNPEIEKIFRSIYPDAHPIVQLYSGQISMRELPAPVLEDVVKELECTTELAKRDLNQ